MKLVGLKKAATGANFSGDIKQLGQTMLWIATVLPEQQHQDPNLLLRSLKAYDPSLYFLLSWMLSDCPPDALEVLRHPYFMTPAERQTFGIALGGGKTCGMIGSYLCDNPHNPLAKHMDDALWSAVKVELIQHLDCQLGVMFDAADKAQAAKRGDLTGGSAGGKVGAEAKPGVTQSVSAKFWELGKSKVAAAVGLPAPPPQLPSPLPSVLPAATVASIIR